MAASYTSIIKRSRNSSLGKVAEISEDAMIEILLRLPVKSLLRFKLVCKTWYHLLKSPIFKSMHHKFNSDTVSQLLMCSTDRFQEEYTPINNHLFSFYSNDNSATVLSQDLRILANPDTFVYLAGCCNGIVCYYDQASAIFLSNPATREVRQLPPTTSPKLCQMGVAFGFDSITSIYDFKVLRLSGSLNKKGFPRSTRKSWRAEMYTLSSNTWKQLDWGLDDSLVYINHRGLFYANSFHFIMRRRHKTPDRTIACCDIHTERFKTMELLSNGNASFSRLMVFKEFLSAVCHELKQAEEMSMEIWIMKNYGVAESWTKLYRFGPPWGHSLAKCFWNEDDALLLLERKTYKLVSCHLNTLRYEPIVIHGYKVHSQVVVYKETLVSIM